MIIHSIEPVYDENSVILILGSFPSVKSREQKFFYGHPQNRFWKVLAGVFGEGVPQTVPEKKRFLLEYRVAVWDVIHSCEIEGSSDSTIRCVTPNDLHIILDAADIRRIYVNGRKAEELYRKYIQTKIPREAVFLPSTSPANAAWGLEELTEYWREQLTTVFADERAGERKYMGEKRKCPCCGCLTLEEERGSYAICPVCYWEDDPVQESDPAYAGGANSVGLMKARENYQKYGASQKRFVSVVRRPFDGEE